MLADLLNSGELRVAAYCVASAACLMAALRSGRTAGRGNRAVPLFWVIAAVVLALLALARVIELGNQVADTGRTIFRTEGWYPDRRTVQKKAILGLLLVAGLVGAAGTAVFIWRRWALILPAFLILTALVTFVSVRAISFHDVDALLYRRSLMHVRINAIAELGFITMLGLSAAAGVAFSHARRQNPADVVQREPLRLP